MKSINKFLDEHYIFTLCLNIVGLICWLFLIDCSWIIKLIMVLSILPATIRYGKICYKSIFNNDSMNFNKVGWDPRSQFPNPGTPRKSPKVETKSEKDSSISKEFNQIKIKHNEEKIDPFK